MRSSLVPYWRASVPASVRLLCIPYAGGSAALYREWQDAAPSFLDIVPVELPGHGTRFTEMPFTDVHQAVQSLGPVFRSLIDRPYALFGYSLGALIAFELCRYLEQHSSVECLHLFASACRAPQVGQTKKPVHALPKDEFFSYIRSLNGTDEGVFANQELLSIFEPMLRADLEMAEEYTFKPASPLRCGVSVLSAQDDTEVRMEHLQQWSKVTNGPFRAQVFPGDHFFIHQQWRMMLSEVSRTLIEYPFIRNTGS